MTGENEHKDLFNFYRKEAPTVNEGLETEWLKY
jgi:hypothetical protein